MAVDAVSRWRFKPASRDRQPVAVMATIEVNFRLE
jgi:outer membrane biosynthesis protein TonB